MVGMENRGTRENTGKEYECSGKTDDSKTEEKIGGRGVWNAGMELKHYYQIFFCLNSLTMDQINWRSTDQFNTCELVKTTN